MALRTPNPGEASLKPATGQELLHRANHNRAQWSRVGFEAFLITSDITVEVVFEKLVKSRVLGQSLRRLHTKVFLHARLSAFNFGGILHGIAIFPSFDGNCLRVLPMWWFDYRMVWGSAFR
jgi:hypothetical protein